MKTARLLLLCLLTGTLAAAQTPEPHRIVFQMTSADSTVHKAFIRQLGNIISVAPDARIEVVCHGPGLDMVLSEQSRVKKGIADMSAKGIVFVGCEFTLKQRNLTREALTSGVGTVPSAIIEIVTKQEEGWSYIKSGF
ncbi:MAG: DsrE family protein [Bacteroidia bacterium]|nr:DsrE family protein [Bacteroidia bacterium]